MNHTKVLVLAALGDTAEVTAQRMPGTSVFMVQAYRKEARQILNQPSMASTIVPAIRAGYLSIDNPTHPGYIPRLTDLEYEFCCKP